MDKVTTRGQVGWVWILGVVMALAWVCPATAQMRHGRSMRHDRMASSSSFDRWQVRTTVLGLFFDADSDQLNLDVDNTAALAIDVGYFVSPHFVLQALATYTNLEVRSNGTSLGSVNLLPPIFTFQLHPLSPDSLLQPYIGVGFNYNYFNSESGALHQIDANVEDSFGGVAELGVDYQTPIEHVYVNLNFKYLYTSPEVHTDLGDTSLKINSYIAAGGIGYRF